MTKQSSLILKTNIGDFEIKKFSNARLNTIIFQLSIIVNNQSVNLKVSKKYCSSVTFYIHADCSLPAAAGLAAVPSTIANTPFARSAH